jgi:outer membrane immunogenic protein
MNPLANSSQSLFAAAFLVALFTCSAHADGIPEAYQPSAACCFSWSGFYFGANAGAAWSDSRDISFSGTDTGTNGLGSEIADGTTPSRARLDWGTSFTGGAQAGYNWQLSNLVMGLEADLQWLNGHANLSTVSTNPLRPTITTSLYREQNMLATIRGRVGIAVWERSMFYLTGGLGVGDANVRISSSCPGCPTLTANPTLPRDVTSASAGTPTGFVWGGGYEATLGSRVSVKAEYLHFDLGQNQTTVTYDYSSNTSSMTGKVHDGGDILRIGVNFKLDQAGEPPK